MGYREYDDAISLMGMDLGVGDRSTHLKCPKCSDPRNTFVIWADADGLAYKCYRASCNLRGKVGGVVSYQSKKTRKVAPGWEWLRPEPVPDDVSDYLCERFYLTRDDLFINGVMWDEGSERVLMPITGLNKGLEGYIARTYPELQYRAHPSQPKAKAIFRPTPEGQLPTCLMKPWGSVRDTLVVLEDYWSAVRVNQHTPACALSGTSVGQEAIRAILKAGVSKLVFVLDADAINTARKLVREHALMFKAVGFVPLTGADPKDLTPSQLVSQVIQPIRRFYGGEGTIRGSPLP